MLYDFIVIDKSMIHEVMKLVVKMKLRSYIPMVTNRYSVARKHPVGNNRL